MTVRLRRAPTRVWLTLAMLPALSVLIGLGIWQWERRDWKNALVAHMEARMTAPPLVLPAQIGTPSSLDYRRVSVRGRFLHGRELHVTGRTHQGRAGIHVITPLVRADGAGVVLVNRGWVPLDRRASDRRADGQLTGEVTVEGIARLPGAQRAFVPDNQPTDNLWFWFDLPAMARAVGVESDSLAPVVVDAVRPAPPSGLPVPGQTRVDLPQNHLGYALTWFGLALALVVVYWVYLKRDGQRQPGFD